jgi:hypothetical protein
VQKPFIIQFKKFYLFQTKQKFLYAEGCETKISGKLFLPLDRQVQLAIGLGVFVGSVLGYLVSPNFFILSGFFGAGLVFAGLTGYCGLAVLMAKMPWNKGSKNVISCSIVDK